MVGEEGARRAWLVAQHADRQLDLQRRASELMERAAAQGDADRAQVAMLQDRLAVNEGRKQRFGTQIGAVVDGRPVPWPCEDSASEVDRLRAGVGLAPFEEHVSMHAP